MFWISTLMISSVMGFLVPIEGYLVVQKRWKVYIEFLWGDWATDASPIDFGKWGDQRRRVSSGRPEIRGEGSPLGDQRSEEKGLLWETRDQRRRISPDHAGMKNISAEVSIICLWTNWIHLIICSKIEFRKLYYCSRCALHKICEMCTFDRCPRGWSDQKSFFGLWRRKKRELENT